MNFFRFYLFGLLLISKGFIAQLIQVDLVVLQPEGKKLLLFVNDTKINEVPQAIVKATGLAEGWCKLKAELPEENRTVMDSIRIKGIEKYSNKEITLSLTDILKDGKKSLKFEFISIGEKSGPIKPVVPELPVYLSELTENAVFGNLFQITRNKPEYFKNYDSTSGKCNLVLSDKDIEYHNNLIKKTNDFTDRLKFTEKAIMRNCYSSASLIQLLNTLEIEMDKLKLSKKAYFHLTDKENAQSVVAAFKFKSMSEDYENFLKDIAEEKKQKEMNCSIPVIDAKFNEIYLFLVKIKYEHDKIAVAKKQAHHYCFTSQQVKKMVDLFTHDREKLELAKTAYNSVTDKANYKILTECFMFSENKNEFLSFISN